MQASARPGTSPGEPASAPERARASEVVAVALAVLAGLVLIARPANEGSWRFLDERPASRVEVADLLPRAVNRVQASATEPLVSSSPQIRRVSRPGSRPTSVDAREPWQRERLQSP